MTRPAVLIRARDTDHPIRFHIHGEPVKVRVCRDCYRVHGELTAAC